MKSIKVEDFTKSLFVVFGETFDNSTNDYGNLFLDKGTDFFCTLEGIDASAASNASGPGGTTIAAHCEHVRFYLEFLKNYLSENFTMVDWKDSWKVTTVDEPAWSEIRSGLRSEFDALKEVFDQIEVWNEHKISGALAIVAHSAYHLGAVRQMAKNVS